MIGCIIGSMSHESDFWIGVMVANGQEVNICRKAASKLRVPVSILSGNLESIRKRYHIKEGQSHCMIYTENRKAQERYLAIVHGLVSEAEKSQD